MSNHFFPIFIVATIAACSFAISARADDLNLTGDAKKHYVIVLPQSPAPAELRGANELQAHLQQLTNVDFPIISDKGKIPELAIFVGKVRQLNEIAPNLDLKSLGLEGFAIKSAGPRLLIVGNTERGTMYGCYTLLEKLGVRFFTHKVTKVPTTQKLTLAAVDETQLPAFEYREPFFTEAFDKDWAASLKINGHHAHLDMTTGGHVVYGRFVHTFDELVPPALHKDHPEYFPLRDGKRKSGYVQRCLTNADVLKLSIAKVKQWIDENPEATIFSVSQNDTGEWCECEHCKELTTKYGGHSGLYLWFVNQVGDAIAKEHPDKLIDTLAYQFTEAAPKDISPSANVRIRLCPINCCEAHPYEECRHDANKAFLKNLAAWHEVAKTLYIWHYNTDFANYLQPFPDFKEFPAEARLYKKSGVIGVFFQGAYAPGGGGSDAELRSYVMAKLLWNTDVDTDALVTEWMDGVYGPAAKPMRAWFDLLHEKVADKNQHFFIYSPPTIYYLNDDVLAQGDKFFDEAEKLVADNPLQREYIDKARLSLRCVKLQHHPTDGPEFESFMKDVRRFGITQLNEGRPVDQWEKDYLAPLKKKK